ncbi:hypothetical protein [Halocella sp. SP3-1]|uniref:phage tail fiber protein n=1 Tax=Halocella sp. SP3-1 TaxID=2382161 RepID=UPI000F74E608|nr:hypothetical protein [Halocella sp. SP3-1]AZO93561.1 hypothetical protein D7D81_02525 [Halocella sp. SP3-1]
MANISNYLEEKILNHIFNGITYNSPITIYLGLVNDIATDTELEEGDLTNEITAYSGDRKVISFTGVTQADGKATIENDTSIDFVDMPVTNVKYAIVCDSTTGGNILYWCPATNVREVFAGDTYRIPAGGLQLTLN